MNAKQLEGRTALVTGGSRGIGRACCTALAEAGANVAINFRRNKTAARETERQVRAYGVDAHLAQADVSSADDVERLVQDVSEQLGPVELLVNNAGVFDYASHEQTPPELWQRALDHNLTSAYLVTWAVKGSMIGRGFGRIVNVTSIAGLRPRPMSIAYSVSKAGLIALTRSAAAALAEHNIRINAVAPGLIDTDILDGVDRPVLEKLIQATPIPRMGEPEEIADVVMFLLSEQSRFMTGQTVVASGGRVTLP